MTESTVCPAGSQGLKSRSCTILLISLAAVCAVGGWEWDIPNILGMARKAGPGQKDVQEAGLTLQKRCAQCCLCHMGSRNHKLRGQAWEMAATGETKTRFHSVLGSKS